MRHRRAATLLLCLVAPVLHAASPIKVPLTADHWRPVQDADNPEKTDVQFIGHEGFPQGAIVLKNGSVAPSPPTTPASSISTASTSSSSTRRAHLAPDNSHLVNRAGQTRPARLARPRLGLRQRETHHPREKLLLPRQRTPRTRRPTLPRKWQLPHPPAKGFNQITLVLYSATHEDPKIINYYGWGAILRFEDPKGLHLSNPQRS